MAAPWPLPYIVAMNSTSLLVNPWLAPPKHKPFVLSDDAPKLQAYSDYPSSTAYRLHLLPLPFQGRPDAPIVVLGLNPGYDEGDETKQTTDYFIETNLRNYRHDSTLPYPLFFLDPEIEGETSGAGQKWWHQRLKPLRQHYNDDKLLARSILSVQYVPYRSKTYKHSRNYLESQKYGFELVRQAVERGALIIALRSGRLWEEAVPELKEYARFYQLSNPRYPVLSEQQFRHKPEGWPALLTELDRIKQATT
jgi:hypothetical protein